MKLYERRFEYTQEGLLDDTHIRFFAENSLESFVEGTGYVITAKQYKTITTGMTEQYRADPFSCTDELRRMLRKRRNGEVYQFVLELKKETEQVSSYQKCMNTNICRQYMAFYILTEEMGFHKKT